MAWTVRILAGASVAYFAIIVLLWALQSRMLFPAPQQRAPLPVNFEEIVLQTSDDLGLRSFYRPAAAGLPTLVYFHGNASTLSAALISNAPFDEAGFGQLLVEYRGYGGNPGSPGEEGFYLDGEAALGWLADQGIESSETVIIGNSIGSGVASEMALRHDPAALILIAPFTSLPDVAAQNFWWLPVHALVKDKFKTKEKLGELDMPVLIQHGTADNLIPHSHGKRLSEIARNGEFQSFEGSGHGLSFERQSAEARRDWVLMLDLGSTE
ncbi:MAG: alpha/beta hydrolase [Erythrobacter sp.]